MRHRALFLLSLVSCLLRAGGWPAIPQEVWAMKEDPAQGIRGAVVLEDRMTFRNVMVEYVYRVRILSEAGKAAAEFDEFPDKAHDFEGRTVYPDGREVVFNKRKDFQSKIAAKVGGSEFKRTVVVPPGLSTDCVVELRWKESADSNPNPHWVNPLPARMGLSTEWRLSHPYLTKELIIEVPTSFPWSYQVFPSRSFRPEMSEKGGYRTFTFRDLPAVEEIPYGLAVTRDVPKFTVFFQPENLRFYLPKGPEAYWKGAARIYFQDIFSSSLTKGRSYDALLQELSAGLPAEPQAQAFQLLMRLQGRIRNASWPTFEEKEKETKKESEEGYETEDLGAIARAGVTDSTGMTHLYFTLLKDRGLNPKIGAVADRDLRLFQMDHMDVFQFNRHMMIVEEAGKPPLWLDPTLRYSVPGLIHPDFQGTPALVIDPKDWSVGRQVVPVQSQAFNLSTFTYTLDPQEDALGFKMSASFQGYPEFQERTRFMHLEAKEQNRQLKEDLELNLKNASFSRVEVQHAQDPKSNLSLVAEGQLEQEPQRRREIYPFPGMTWPLWIPERWPDVRKDFIVIPYLRTQSATSVFKLPKGYAIGEFIPYERSNRFGKVRWAVIHQEGQDDVKVELKVEIASLLEGPDSYDDFRVFLGWVRDVCGRSIYIEKSR